MLNSRPIAVFRYEASPQLGAGHAMRCHVLAAVLLKRNWECYVATTKASYDFLPGLNYLKRIDPDELWSQPFQHDLLVIDNYDLDVTYEQHFRSYAKTLLVIDDLADREHDCDFLIDQTFGRNASDYSQLISTGGVVLTGTEYALLRPEFVLARAKAWLKRKKTRAINKILLNMGGSDPKNLTLEVLKIIKKSAYQGSIDVVLGFCAPHFESVQTFSDSMRNDISLISHSNDMADLIYQADFAIGAAGSSMWERCVLGLPCLMVPSADNQKFIYHTLCSYFSLPPEKLNASLIDSYLHNMDLWHRFSELAFKVCDGFGANRVLNHVLGNFSNIQLIKATPEHLEITYQMQQEKDLRQHFVNPQPPTWEEHKAWFAKRIKHSMDLYHIILFEGHVCGAICLTFDEIQNVYDLSWYLVKEYQGKGIGTTVVKMATSLVSPFKIRAFVKPANKASLKSLYKSGFTKIKGDFYISS